MNTERIKITEEFPVTGKQIYDTWLNAKKHSEFTGAKASINKKTGGKFTAWDNYIEGTNKQLIDGKLIVQSWRTTEFPENSEDSLLEIKLDDTSSGCRLTLTHSNIPEGQSESYKQGWVDFYFKPLKEYFDKKLKYFLHQLLYFTLLFATAGIRKDIYSMYVGL
jgi:activator of HSP90 ATPase